jgi:tripartite-type tricarboxylate transporter receptor subunit TctC
MQRRSILAAPLLLLAKGVWAAPGKYPNRPITILVGTPPGSAPDILARRIGTRLQEEIGQTIIIENKVGARGIIAANAVARAKPDGYTLLMGYAAQLCVEPAINSEVPFNTVKDFSAVSMVDSLSAVLTVKGDSDIKSVPDLIEHARKSTKEITIGTSFSTAILLSELLQKEANIKLLRVGYKQSSDATLDLLAGRIDVDIGVPAAIVQYIKSGEIRALAVFDPTRNPALPDIPSITEFQLPSVSFIGWNAIFAPAGTSAEVIDFLDASLSRILAEPEIVERMNFLGVAAATMKRAEFEKFVGSEITRFTEIATADNLRNKI